MACFGKIFKQISVSVVFMLQASTRCSKLSLRHYMLKPVQRIPQYRLLLQGESQCNNLKPPSVVVECKSSKQCVSLFLSSLVIEGTCFERVNNGMLQRLMHENLKIKSYFDHF